MEISEEGEWIRFNSDNLKVEDKGDRVVLRYQDQSAEFLAADVVRDGTSIRMKKDVLPIVANGKVVPQRPQVSVDPSVAASSGREMLVPDAAKCQCSMCLFFAERCCIPHQDWLGFCFGAWGCDTNGGAGCGSR
jgi:hypothetical protein